MHMATHPIGIKRYIEKPLTTEQPSQYRINDFNTLIGSVAHTYYPEITQPIVFLFQDMKQSKQFFRIKLFLSV